MYASPYLRFFGCALFSVNATSGEDDEPVRDECRVHATAPNLHRTPLRRSGGVVLLLSNSSLLALDYSVHWSDLQRSAEAVNKVRGGAHALPISVP